jgi:hypothetical protein
VSLLPNDSEEAFGEDAGSGSLLHVLNYHQPQSCVEAYHVYCDLHCELRLERQLSDLW